MQAVSATVESPATSGISPQAVDRDKLDPRVLTISQATDLWLGELARQRKSPRTRDKYQRCLDKLADMYPHADVSEVTPNHCRKFIDQWRDHSPATLAGHISSLNRFFAWLYDEKLVKRNPMDRIHRPRQTPPEENDRVVTVSSDDVDKLFGAVSAWDELLALSVLAYLGPRRHAAATMRLRDYERNEYIERIDEATGEPVIGRKPTLRFHEKGDKVIVKPCPDRLADVIEGAIAAGVYESSDDYLIPGKAQQRREGERDDRIVWRLVHAVAKRAGVRTHVHALRAAFAVRFLQAKPDEILALKELMGHRRIETTLIYLRRLERREKMESVRDLAWGENSGFAQIAAKLFEAKPEAEKEGFEPSMEAFTPITP
jgi:site-specific recombinase XerD